MHTIIITGRITKPLELRETKTGIKYVRFVLASNYLNGKEVETTYFPVICYEQKAEYLVNYVKDKGKITIQGIVQNSSYIRNNITHNSFVVKVKNIDIADFKEIPGDNFIDFYEED